MSDAQKAVLVIDDEERVRELLLAAMPQVRVHCIISQGAHAVLRAECESGPELLAQYVYRRMRDLLSDYPVRLAQVMVSEKNSSRAYYSEGSA